MIQGERPEWASSMNNKDDTTYSYHKTAASSYVAPDDLKKQKEGLPIYKLRPELEQAIIDNRILVVIGETGSGKTT